MTLDDDDDLLAAEYALGTLDARERADAAVRRASDAGFDRAVTDWEIRLGPLSDASRDADPSPLLWRAILARVDALSRTAADVIDTGRLARLQREVVRWRAVTAFSTALAAALALWIAVGQGSDSRTAQPELIAFLQASGDEPAYVIRADLKGETIAVRPVSAKAPEGKSYELWIIDPTLGAPRSLGVLDAAVSTRRLPAGIPGNVVSRATYAVTTEPFGGSPNGVPAGSPVFLGHLVSAPR